MFLDNLLYHAFILPHVSIAETVFLPHADAQPPEGCTIGRLSHAPCLTGCRLRSRDYSRPLASELDVKVSLHPAQAWDNAPGCACGPALAGRGFDTVRPLA